jgi:rhodanese-related sulfurtransferase
VETDPSDVYADTIAGCDKFVVIDARSPDAFNDAHLPGAISLPHRLIDEASTAFLDKGKPIIVYCWGPGCNAATKGALQLSKLGFQVKEMIGGFEYWVREGLPIEGAKTANPDLVGAISAD